jgi:hypothetical protein
MVYIDTHEWGEWRWWRTESEFRMLAGNEQAIRIRTSETLTLALSQRERGRSIAVEKRIVNHGAT